MEFQKYPTGHCLSPRLKATADTVQHGCHWLATVQTGSLNFTIERSAGGVVDAELLRPRWWIERHGIEAGQMLPMNIEELQVVGLATVTDIDECPEIAAGEGSPVTGRFITRQVDILARIEVLGADGQVETIEGTTIHPIWSVDRDDWIPLGELEQGELLLGAAGRAVVLSHVILQRSTPVYNIEVHGEHVYEVGYWKILAHNSAGCVGTFKELRALIKGSRLEAHYLIEKRFAGVLGQKPSEMMSMVVNPKQHAIFTKAWRASFPYGTDYGKLSAAQVEAAARQIYAKFPIILDALGL